MPLTNGSGPARPKNMRILRIWIRIPNTVANPICPVPLSISHPPLYPAPNIPRKQVADDRERQLYPRQYWDPDPHHFYNWIRIIFITGSASKKVQILNQIHINLQMTSQNVWNMTLF